MEKEPVIPFNPPSEEKKVEDNKVEKIDQSWSILRLVQERTPRGWEEVFKAAKRELEDISHILARDEAKYQYISFPPRKSIFHAFELTPLDKVICCIVGQDPYHNEGQAMGLSFSVPKGVMVPSSLKNIYKELTNTIENFRAPSHGDLSYWASQGVLLLNQCLTVRPHQPGSHGDLWRGLIMRVIQYILERNKNCIFLLLGKEAQRVTKLMGGRGKVVTAAHPSGLSANRGFFGSDVFNKVNKLLIEDGKKPIDWRVDPPSS